MRAEILKMVKENIELEMTMLSWALGLGTSIKQEDRKQMKLWKLIISLRGICRM